MKQRMTATAVLVAISLCVGCQTNKLGTRLDGQCDSAAGACTDGCCESVEDYSASVSDGRGGPLAALHGRKTSGPQSHTGSQPGPAMGQASPTYGYPYYTTRGPRDFLNPNPPSIGP